MCDGLLRLGMVCVLCLGLHTIHAITELRLWHDKVTKGGQTDEV